MKKVAENWEKLIISGLTYKNGEAYDITVGAPKKNDGAFMCRLQIPGVLDREIYGEDALSVLISTLRVVQVQVYEPSPSPALISKTTLTEDDYPDLNILFQRVDHE
jgi:hypothetical protein